MSGCVYFRAANDSAFRPIPTLVNSTMAKVQIISPGLIDSLVEAAKSSPRRRINHNFHETLEENPNRFLNVMLKDTYFVPHRHANPPKAESFLVLRGNVLCIIFNNRGEITDVHRLGEGDNYGVDIAAGVWHTIIVLSDSAVCFETKPGPYVAATDKEFAPWAPKEGDAESAAYLEKLAAEAISYEGTM